MTLQIYNKKKIKTYKVLKRKTSEERGIQEKPPKIIYFIYDIYIVEVFIDVFFKMRF